MNRRFGAKLAVLAGAVVLALAMTILVPAPRGLIPYGVGEPEVRAAPGTPASRVKPYDLSQLKVFSQTLVKIRDNYVDPTRIDAKGMLIAALDYVQRNIAEVMVEARRDRNEIVVQVNDKTQTFSIADVDTVWRLSSRLKEIFRFIQANMNPTSDAAQIEYAAVNGMLGTLDPHSALLDPEAADEMDAHTSGKFGGIGIVIGIRKDKATGENKLTVLSLIDDEDTPARKAGLKAGDRIIKINDDQTVNLTIAEAMNRLRGDPATKVNILVERAGVSGLAQYTLTRDIIQVTQVESKLLPGNVGYLKIKSFSQDVASDLRRAMETLRGQGAKAWILDLRGNPGGLLDQAVKVSDLFLETGTIVTTVGYAGKQRDEKRAQIANTDAKSPVIVLLNGGSASASEIVAGALKQLDRAIMVGQTSFGKGSVQVLYDYDDGSKLKLTIAQYLTPNDVSIQGVGITPDIQLDRVFIPTKVAGYKDFMRLLRLPNRMREADYDAHLTNKNVRTGEKPLEVVRYFEEPKSETDDEDAGMAEDESPPDGFVEDWEIRFARELAANASSPRRKDLLKEVRATVAKRRADEEARIASALAKLGIDWAAPPATKVAGARLKVTITSDKAGNKVTAGDVVAVTGTVTNTGSAPAYQVHAQAKSDDWPFEGAELVFGKIDPGQTRAYTVWLKVPKEAESRVDELEWKFTEAQGTPIEGPVMKMAIEGQPRPQFAYTHQIIDEKGNGDGLVTAGESIRLHVTLKNVGRGKAEAPTATLRSASGDRVVVNKGRFELKTMQPGEQRTLDFTFDVKKDFAEKDLVVELVAYDSELREGLSEKMRFPIHEDVPSVVPSKGFVKSKKELDVREGAAEDSVIIGTLKKGGQLAETGKVGPWVRVELESGRPGFVPAGAVTSAGGSSTGAFTQVWQVTPPTLALQVPSLETTGDSWKLDGTASDDHHVEDVYVLVSNRDAKIDARKVFYASNRGRKTPTKLDFSTQIPVWPGSNMITVVARENNDVKSVQTVWIHKTSAAKTASVTP